MKKKKQVTIQDVADEAGVSIATVSRAMNNPSIVDASSHRKVADAIAKLDYKLRQPIRYSQARTLAIILPSASNAFFAQMLEGVLLGATQHSYQTLVFSCHGDPGREEACLRLASRAQVDGLLFCPLADGSAQLAQALFAESFPLLVLYRRSFLQHRPHIYYNNEQGGYLATKLLLRLGRRNIAFFIGFWQEPGGSIEEILALIDDPRRGSYASLDRLAGYLRAISEFGLVLDPTLLCTTDYTFESGYERTKQFLSTLRDFDAVLCGNDSVAAGVLQALREQHIQVPSQVSVIGYDDSTLASIARPELTSVYQDAKQLGVRSVEMIGSLFDKGEVGDVVLDTYLTIRSSTAMKQA